MVVLVAFGRRFTLYSGFGSQLNVISDRTAPTCGEAFATCEQVQRNTTCSCLLCSSVNVATCRKENLAREISLCYSEKSYWLLVDKFWKAAGAFCYLYLLRTPHVVYLTLYSAWRCLQIWHVGSFHRSPLVELFASFQVFAFLSSCFWALNLTFSAVFRVGWEFLVDQSGHSLFKRAEIPISPPTNNNARRTASRTV